jgi:hypothetical protein
MSSNVFTLDSLREETERKFAPTVVALSDGSTVELKSLLRLGKKERDEALKAIEEINEIEPDEEDDSVDLYSELVCESIEKVFRLIANKPKRLIPELDHDDPSVKVSIYTAVLSRWMGESQLGEAESSQS